MQRRLTRSTAGFAGILALILASFGCGPSTEQRSNKHGQSPLEKHEALLAYGIQINKPGAPLQAIVDTVQKNQFLADILLGHGVPYGLIDQLARDREVFDVRYIRPGQPYTILKDSDSTSRHFIYEINRIDYATWTFHGDSAVSVERSSKPIERRQREVVGVIKSSLYETLIAADAPIELTNRLADVYAWSLDFYRIQPGDRFKAVYTENFVDDQSVGVAEIHSAVFNYRGVDFWAFYFDQDSLGSFYDEEGNSLQRAFLQAPVKFSRISSRYSKRRFHPVQKRYKAHLGTDYAAPHGTPIRSTGDGTVIAAGYTSGNGNYVKIRHNSIYTTQYLHMSKFAKGMKAGKAVKQGDVIGYVGSTGLATGPHVCYRFWKNGVQVDPFLQDIPPAFPVREELREVYDQQVENWMQQLKSLPYPDDVNPVQAEITGDLGANRNDG